MAFRQMSHGNIESSTQPDKADATEPKTDITYARRRDENGHMGIGSFTAIGAVGLVGIFFMVTTAKSSIDTLGHTPKPRQHVSATSTSTPSRIQQPQKTSVNSGNSYGFTALIDGEENPFDASCSTLNSAIGFEVMRGAQKYSTGDFSNTSDEGTGTLGGSGGGIPGTFQEMLAANLIQVYGMKGCARQ